LTNPAIQITGIDARINNRAPTMVINWKASDKNLGQRPITLSYSDKETGPWQVIASNLENTGSYTWQVPTNGPNRLFIRAEPSDLAGNVGVYQTPKAAVTDLSQPTVSILAVEPGHK